MRKYVLNQRCEVWIHCFILRSDIPPKGCMLIYLVLGIPTHLGLCLGPSFYSITKVPLPLIENVPLPLAVAMPVRL